MTTYPIAGHISDATRTEGEVKADLENTIQASKELPGGGAQTTLTIVNSAITPTAAAHLVDATGASTNLQNAFIINTPDGRVLTLRSVSKDRDIVVLHAAGGTGQFHLARGSSFTLADPRCSITFQLNGTYWEEINRSYGPDVIDERASLGIDVPSISPVNTYNIIPSDWNRHIIARGNGGWTLGGTDPGFAAIDGFKIYFENESLSNIQFGPRPAYMFKPGEGAVIMCNYGNWSVLKGIAAGGTLPVAAQPYEISNEAAVNAYITPDKLYASKATAQAWVLVAPASTPPGVYNAWHTSSVVRNGVGNWTWILTFLFPTPYWTSGGESWISTNGWTLTVYTKTQNAAQMFAVNYAGNFVDGGLYGHIAFGNRL